jgi:hypothetical protein
MLDSKGATLTVTSCVSCESRRDRRGCEAILLPEICELLSLLSTVMCVQSSVPQTFVCVCV